MNVSETYGEGSVWTIAPSTIHGVGIFSTRDLHEGELIGIAIKLYVSFIPSVTHFGSKINHSYSPNAVLRYDYSTNTYNVYAMTNIRAGTEITTDYRFTPFFIAKPSPHFK